ncbi:LOW QUALITY PROTEIN: hypothetical protein HZS_7822 [Henneguya salminicola]|nr:LOW QUALITY PROTEIN: hypothetical protein HZS_7822 [Henneguya salminicola]
MITISLKASLYISLPLFPIILLIQSERTEYNKCGNWHNAFTRLIKENPRNICLKFLASLPRELSLIEVKIKTIHIRTT